MLKNKLHVVLLTDCLPDIQGGAEKQIFELAKRLDKSRYVVTVASLECGSPTPRYLFEVIGCQLQTFKVVRVYGLSGLIQGLRFKKFLQENKADILQTYHFSSDMWGTFWGKISGVPVIISNRRDIGFWRDKIHMRAYQFINRWVNTIITNTHTMKQIIMDTEGVSEDKIKIIFNGIDIPRGHKDVLASKRDLNLRLDDIVIMHVANLRPVKGHRYLIKAFSQIVGDYPSARLILIGKDELKRELQNLVQTLGIKEKVFFLGQRTDVQDLLAISDICVLPSLSEGMSNAILEYMAMAKPVIATKVGGNPELVRNGYNGLLVEKENVEELKEALLELLRDKEKRHHMGEKGLLRVKTEFSMEAMMARYEGLFAQMALSSCGALRPSYGALSTGCHDRIKVLHLVSSGGLFGAERVILNLTASSQEVDSYVGALYNHHNPHLEVLEEAKRMGLKNVFFESRGRFDLHTMSEVKRFLVVNDIDILHTHNYKTDIIGFWASRWAGKKWIATNHVWHSTDKKLKFYEMMDAFVLKFAQKVVSVSNGIKGDLLKKGLKEDHLQIIANGIPIESFDREFPIEQTRIALGVQPHECAVVMVARLAVEKGHEIFLKAASKVIEKTKNIKFIIVGDGPLAGSLNQNTKELNLSPYVIFTGIRHDMPAIYASCDIIVNASFIEGLPMTILEAMASHLPVIATKVGGVEQVIKNQENGILLEPGDPEILASAIMELVADKSKRKRFADKAYQDACDRFSDTRMASQYQQIYRDVMSS